MIGRALLRLILGFHICGKLAKYSIRVNFVQRNCVSVLLMEMLPSWYISVICAVCFDFGRLLSIEGAGVRIIGSDGTPGPDFWPSERILVQ